MPNIADSPFVSIDPGMRVVYYTGLYFGLHCHEGTTDQKQAQAAYFKSLEAVPDWLNSAKGTIMDAQIACLAVRIFSQALSGHQFDILTHTLPDLVRNQQLRLPTIVEIPL